MCVSHAWCMYVPITHQYTSLHRLPSLSCPPCFLYHPYITHSTIRTFFSFTSLLPFFSALLCTTASDNMQLVILALTLSGTAYQCTKSHKQVIGLNISLNILTPEAICCRLQTCKCGFDIRVVLCTSVPSLIVRNANTSKL